MGYIWGFIIFGVITFPIISAKIRELEEAEEENAKKIKYFKMLVVGIFLTVLGSIAYFSRYFFTD